ncbi:MAG: DUF427 domain-containing protein [Solirubrobacterales bacterium]|nr:DUF427 domain-containing protein [Solirubrobacterales bacterium]
MREALMGRLAELRYEPTEKRIRAMLADRPVIDSKRAMLVWEPKRVTPAYAVPADDIDAELSRATSSEDPGGLATSADRALELVGRPVYDPSVPFSVHTTDGQSLDVRIDDERHENVAFRPTDPALEGYVILEFDTFDAWYEEDELNVGHPRDPFHRIEIVHSSRSVRVELGGALIAESTTPYLLFEPPLPVRYYLPAEDIVDGALRPSETRTRCAYKGEAAYWSTDGDQDVAWSYAEPLREAREVTGRIAFFNERVDLIIDGQHLNRPITPWSKR